MHGPLPHTPGSAFAALEFSGLIPTSILRVLLCKTPYCRWGNQGRLGLVKVTQGVGEERQVTSARTCLLRAFLHTARQRLLAGCT